MRAMRAMRRRAMKRSVIARGKMAKSQVFRGLKAKTSGNLKQTDLMKNPAGKVVSKKRSKVGKMNFFHIQRWLAAVKKARKLLNLQGKFVLVNEKTPRGRALYAKAKEIYGGPLPACERGCLAIAVGKTGPFPVLPSEVLGSVRECLR